MSLELIESMFGLFALNGIGPSVEGLDHVVKQRHVKVAVKH